MVRHRMDHVGVVVDDSRQPSRSSWVSASNTVPDRLVMPRRSAVTSKRWDQLAGCLATGMGPLGLPVMGPPAVSLKDGSTLVKVSDLLGRRGVVVPYRTSTESHRTSRHVAMAHAGPLWADLMIGPAHSWMRQ